MHPDQSPHDPSRDPILDGRDSLRLVKLRLSLTLVAVALLPIAAVSPLVRAVAEEARVAHHERLADQAFMAATEVRREIAHVQSAAASLVTDTALVEAAGDDANAASRKKAANRLA